MDVELNIYFYSNYAEIIGFFFFFACMWVRVCGRARREPIIPTPDLNPTLKQLLLDGGEIKYCVRLNVSGRLVWVIDASFALLSPLPSVWLLYEIDQFFYAPLPQFKFIGDDLNSLIVKHSRNYPSYIYCTVNLVVDRQFGF